MIDRIFFAKSKHNKNNSPIFPALVLSLFALLFGASGTYAVEFAGDLKVGTITDQAGSNIPPSAVVSVTQNGDTFSLDASGSTDPDGSIMQYKWDFGDGTAGVGVSTTHQFQAVGTYPVLLTITDNNGAVALKKVNVSKPFVLAVNFQPATTVVPTGFVADTGKIFDPGVGIGWLAKAIPSYWQKERNSSLSPDKSYDTNFFGGLVSSYVWEAQVPPGTYTVTVCVGDPSYPGNTHNIQIEGQTLMQNVSPTTTTRWVQQTKAFTVNDGRLTMTFAGSSSEIELCWIKIHSAP